MVGSTFPSFALSTGSYIGNAGWLSVAAVVVVAMAAVRARPRSTVEGEARAHDLAVPSLLMAAVVSFYVCVWILSAARIANPPFARTAVFVPLFVWLAAWLVTRRSRDLLRTISAVLIAVNGATSAALFWTSFVSASADPGRHPIFAELGATPIEKVMRSRHLGPIRAFDCNWVAEPVAQLYGHKLGVPVRVVDALPGACAVGSARPAPFCAVWAVDAGSHRLLCF